MSNARTDASPASQPTSTDWVKLKGTFHQICRRLAKRMWSDPVIIMGLLLVAGLVHGLQMTVTPSLLTTDDEGTYVAQAWAILYKGVLAHYTYWMDHPPGGWIQMAGWAWLTRAFDRYDSAIAVGREFMLVANLASVTLLYLLAKRLGMNKFFSIGAVALFALSPLAVYTHRLTFLDNIAIPWVLAAFLLAASPRNRLAAVIGSAVCFGVAVMTKETILVILPALLWQLYQGTHPRTRKMSFALWSTFFVSVGAVYILMANLKNELLPGPGHVDLLYAIRWQLFDRASSGSIFDPTSTARLILHSWARLDPWLIGMAVAFALPALLRRRLRPVTLAFIIQIAVMLRPGGYLPQPYVIALIPFAALIVAGAVGALWNSGLLNRFHLLRNQIPRTGFSYAQVMVQAPALAIVTVFGLMIAVPQWSPRLHDLMTDNRNVSVQQTMEWVDTHIPTKKGDASPVRILVSDAMWVDLKRRGYAPDWYFKVDLDPAVKANYPQGWQNVDYVIFTNEMNEIAKSDSRADMTTTLASREHGTLVAHFGSLSEKIWIYQVKKPRRTSSGTG